jgi:Flp pilus assembly pilin Flp
VRRIVMLRKFFRDETGLELSEYAVAASLIAVATVLAFDLLGANITAKIEDLADIIE